MAREGTFADHDGAFCELQFSHLSPIRDKQNFRHLSDTLVSFVAMDSDVQSDIEKLHQTDQTLNKHVNTAAQECKNLDHAIIEAEKQSDLEDRRFESLQNEMVQNKEDVENSKFRWRKLARVSEEQRRVIKDSQEVEKKQMTKDLYEKHNRINHLSELPKNEQFKREFQPALDSFKIAYLARKQTILSQQEERNVQLDEILQEQKRRDELCFVDSGKAQAESEKCEWTKNQRATLAEQLQALAEETKSLKATFDKRS